MAGDVLTLAQVKNSIVICRTRFEKLVQGLEGQASPKKRQRLAKEAIAYALKSSTGYYSSPEIEDVFLQVARENVCRLPTTFKKNTCLHVMSESYKTGGHTRVVERWIELADPVLSHSLIFTRKEKQDVPVRLLNAVKDKKGDVIRLVDGLSDVEKGLQLREIASHFEFVVLHVHPDDVVPLIAFGTKDFKRPVLFFNHADHKFWVGVSIADVVVDFRSWGEKLCLEDRDVSKSYTLSLPIDATQAKAKHDKAALRHKLGLPEKGKVIVTVGSAHKYKPILQWNMLDVVQDILAKRQDVTFIVIGPKPSDLPEWEEAVNKYGNRIRIMGRMVPAEMFDYLGASDLSLDSFPMSGGAALLDAVASHKPVLALECPVGHLDYAVESEAYCQDQATLLRKIFAVLSSDKVAQKNVQDVKAKAKKYNDVEVWQARAKALYAEARRIKHGVNTFKPRSKLKIRDIDVYLYSESLKYKRKLHVPFVLDVFNAQKDGMKYVELVFFKVCHIKVPLKHKVK